VRTTFFLFLKKSFYVRMSLIMLTLSLAPLIVLAVIAVNIANKSVETQVNQINYQVIGQVTERIELTMRKLQEMGYQYTSLSIIEDVLSDEGTPYQQVQKKKDLIASMNSTSAALADIDGVYLYSTQTDSVLSTKDALTSLAFSRYKHLLEDFKNSTTSLTFVDRSFTYAGGKAVAFMRRIPFEQFEDLKGIFMVTVPYEVFQKLIQNIDLGNLGSITILSRDGDIIATTSRLSTAQATDRVKALLMKWNQDSSKTQFIWDDSLISIKPTSTLDKWLVYTEIPSQELTKDTAAIARSVRYILYVLLVLGFILVLSFGYYLYKPLQKVRRLLEAIKQSNFTAKEQFHSSNEIGEIGIMLNSLGGKMQSLIHELQETADLKRRNEIRALQAQINPHFLYNSLNTIRMFAMLKDYGKINELMGRLIALLRYSMEITSRL
jgi:two-component system sensor histidine kinase YesM